MLDGFRGRRVLVIGDLILDHYLRGEVLRVSPEAPVPIVSLHSDGVRWVAGGAANVARNILSLGGLPLLAGFVGNDREGKHLLEILENDGVDVDCVVTDGSRPTTTKTRIMSRSHQLIRVDKEVTSSVDQKAADELWRRIESKLPDTDSVVFEDYDKGSIVPDLVERVMEASSGSGIPVVVDPKFRNFWTYRGCSLFKPNRIEAARAMGVELGSAEDAMSAGDRLCEELSASCVLMTLGEEGAVLCRSGQPPVHLPTAAMHVFDVSGAGDTVTAVMALVLGSGVPVEDGARLASFAAAAVCAEPGVYAVRAEDILRETERFSLASRESTDSG
jgi:D-beta-D-heptose 7-phosphate kinase/D-beta-D-heptose 1-phosphate adenosyltransferase